MRAGRCLCGSVTYEIDGEPTVVAHCYCEDCKRVTGAGHATGAMFPVEAVRARGPVAEFACVSARESVVTRTFCPRCGSPLFGRNTGMPGFVTVSVGTLDDPSAVTPHVAVFARSRCRWDPADPSLHTFETQPDWRPEDGF